MCPEDVRDNFGEAIESGYIDVSKAEFLDNDFRRSLHPNFDGSEDIKNVYRERVGKYKANYNPATCILHLSYIEVRSAFEGMGNGSVIFDEFLQEVSKIRERGYEVKFIQMQVGSEKVLAMVEHRFSTESISPSIPEALSELRKGDQVMIMIDLRSHDKEKE
ncbi:MAG: hypothetical protein WCP14_03415 [bacterium]